MSFYFPLILLSVIPYFRRNLPRRPGLSSKSPFPTCTVKMANGTLDKLSYLKRYMSDGKDSAEQNRKKKKKKRNLGNGIMVIDVDSSMRTHKSARSDDEADHELAPTIAEIRDETLPKGMSDSSKWKSIGHKPFRGKPTDENRSVETKQESPDSGISPARRRPSSQKRKSPDSDISPPRRKKYDSTKQRNSSKKFQGSDSDLSPERDYPTKREANSVTKNAQRGSPDSDLSPARSTRSKNTSIQSDRVRSPRSNRSARDERSVLRLDERQQQQGRTELAEPPVKTLSGMSAGLQNAQTLREEVNSRRLREDEMFRKMDADISGRNAETVYRDRKTGKKRDVEAERAAEAEKAERERVHKERFDKWGKGLAQAKKQKEGIDDALHEMDKPLARYVDDVDRDALLKAQDRIGDPMLEYLSKKKSSSSSAAPERPKYKGPPPPPNRFGLLPGYRWDGLDRSNGFEKTRFNRLSNKTAVAEQAYKWSTEDM